MSAKSASNPSILPRHPRQCAAPSLAASPYDAAASAEPVCLPPVGLPAVGMPPIGGAARPAKVYPKYKSGIDSLPSASSAAFSHVRDSSAFDKLYDLTNSWTLGSGANGTVCTITKRKTGETYALKTLPPPEGLDGAEAIRELLADVDMQRSLDHPNIARILDVFVDARRAEVAFVMPLFTGGTVVQYLQRHPCLSEGAKATLVHKMLSAVHYVHRHGIMHRDLKLENFVFDSEALDAELKLIDFGMATRVAPGAETLLEGFTTLLYTAPEMHWIFHRELQKRGRVDPKQDVSYTSAIDLWALGVIAYQLLCGRLPFGLGEDPSEDEEVLIDRIAFEPLSFPPEVELSAAAKASCKALLERDPSQRPNAEAALRLEWIATASSLRPRTAEREARAADASAIQHHQQLVASLVAFSEADVLKRHAYHAAAYTAPSAAAQIKALRQAFVEADTDDSGCLSRDEFEAVMRRHPEAAAGLDIDQLFASIAGANGTIEWRWFLAATLMPAAASAPRHAPAASTRRPRKRGNGAAGRPTAKPAAQGPAAAAKPTKLPAIGTGGASTGGASTGGAPAGGAWRLSAHAPAVVDTFMLLDRDGDHYIDVDDLSALFAASTDPALRALGPKQLQKMMQHAVGSKQPVERLSFDEFKTLMARGHKLSHTVNAAQRTAVPRTKPPPKQAVRAAYGGGGGAWH